jgi:hypothetical protein
MFQRGEGGEGEEGSGSMSSSRNIFINVDSVNSSESVFIDV